MQTFERRRQQRGAPLLTSTTRPPILRCAMHRSLRVQTALMHLGPCPSSVSAWHWPSCCWPPAVAHLLQHVLKTPLSQLAANWTAAEQDSSRVRQLQAALRRTRAGQHHLGAHLQVLGAQVLARICWLGALVALAVISQRLAPAVLRRALMLQPGPCRRNLLQDAHALVQAGCLSGRLWGPDSR